MQIRSFLFILLLSILTIGIRAQGQLKTEYFTASSFEDDDKNKLGSGDFLKISGRYIHHLSAKRNESGQAIVWSASVSGAYAILNNKNMPVNINPGKILNLGVNLTHARPISGRWSLISTLGGGVYSAPDAITAKSILVNGGAIFMYKLMDNLDIGVGAGLTNSYGIPVIMPMSYINWRLPGRYEVNVNITNNMAISGAMMLNEKLKLKLVAMEMGGMSAVVAVEGKSMIYATTTMTSYLCSEYKIGKTSVFYLGAGGTWLRSATRTNRTLKDFFNSIFHDKRNFRFGTSAYMTVGFNYGF